MKDTIIKFLTHKNYDDAGKLLIRLLFGLSLAINHGYPTFSGIFSGEGSGRYPDPLGLGAELSRVLMGTSEFVFALMVAIGLFTRIAVLPVIFGFSVAFFIFHSGDPFGEKEMAYLYLSAFLSIFILGPGKYSFDHLLFKKK